MKLITLDVISYKFLCTPRPHPFLRLISILQNPSTVISTNIHPSPLPSLSPRTPTRKHVTRVNRQRKRQARDSETTLTFAHPHTYTRGEFKSRHRCRATKAIVNNLLTWPAKMPQHTHAHTHTHTHTPRARIIFPTTRAREH